MTPQEITQIQYGLRLAGYNIPITGVYDVATRNAEQDKNTKAAVASYANDPDMSRILELNGGAEGLLKAVSSGDYSQILGVSGQPVDSKAFEAEYQNQMDVLNPSFKEEQEKNKADVEAQLAQKQTDYQQYLIDQGEKFQADKAALDQQAADQGVLFSGGRIQRQNDLKKTYERAQAAKLGAVGQDIGQTARDYQYAYGGEAAQGLSNYYNLGGNTYNPNVARRGVGSSGLSSIYNTGNYNFQGTKPRTLAGEAAIRAYGIGRNLGYKTTPYSYQ